MNHSSKEKLISPAQAKRAEHPAMLSRQAVWQWTTAAGLVVAYVVLEWISFIHESKGLPLTPWNPGLGLAFACLVLGGPQYGIALFAGVIIAEIAVLRSTLEWPVIVAIGAIIASGYAGVATVIRTKFRLDVGLAHLRDVIILLLAAFVGPTVVTLLLAAVLLTGGTLGFGEIVSAGPVSAVGDALGIAVTTPLVLRFARRWRQRTLHLLVHRIPEFALFAVVIVAALWPIARTENADGYTLFYLLFFPVVVAAVRHGLDGACLALAATQFGLVGLLHYHGYDWKIFTEFQVLMFVLTATGLIVGVVVSERQASERVARESEARLKEKEAEVAHAARFSLVSGMATALAHEINQPMAAARALGRSVEELLRHPQPDLSRANQNLTRLIAEIDLAGGILRRMRDFLRRGRPQISTINVPLVLDDTLMLIRPEATSKQVRIDLDFPVDLPTIYGDRIQLQQVILNLVRNAVDSIVESGRADGRIQVTARRSDNAARVEIGVLDNGPGIPADRVDHLFTPLATSKKEGLGLGLSICLGIVESHGGRIWLHSNNPRCNRVSLFAPTRTARAQAIMNTSTVFVIDDQASVRHALCEMLSAFGYNVEAHESADSFLRAFDPLRNGCVVADVRMPGIDGIELVRELGRRRVPLPVVLISGHADVPMAVAAIKAGAEDFIEKPIDDVQLVAAINRSLADAYAHRRLQESTQDLRARFDRLTQRELEVFDLVVQGYTSEAIGERLDISTRTVEGYRVQIMNKMQAESVAVLVRQAIRLNRISP